MEKDKKKYTIEDIARELGVSKTTVSRALSGKGRIGRETVERVQAFVAERGYRPNVIARGLAQSRTYNLGLVIPMEDTDVSFFKECMGGICEKASEYNYDVIMAIMKEDRLTQLHRLVANHKVDGIILTRATVESGAVRFLKEQGIPFVVIGPSDDLEVMSIDNPNREASRELTALLLMKGLRRLSLIGGNSRHYVTQSRKQGFLDAHRDRGFHADDALIFMEVEDYRKAMWAVNRILLAESDGIVCMDDNISALVLGCLRERGVEVPDRIRLASLYDSHQMEQNLPPVTSLHFDTKELGRNACMEMLRMLGEELLQEPQRLNYQVILRESTK
ncbi:MAG TPA: LacI family transcriptional regulator [Lachnospiraceae bacterium]|nr:LacI family transcriptional regulator [Lachnospiraceae bacterium]